MTNPYPQQFAGVPQQQFAAPAPAPAAPMPQQYAAPAPVQQAPQPPPMSPQQTVPQGPAQFGTFVPAATGRAGAGERYDKFPAKDHQGKPLMVRFAEVFTFTSTQGPSKGQAVQGVKVDVLDMTTNQMYVNASWTPVRLVEQVAHCAGDGQVYGIELYGSPTRSGNTMVAAREISDPGTLAAARQMAPAVAAAFDREHEVRQAEAAQAAVQQQQQQQAGGFQQAPAGFGAAQAVGYPAQQTHGQAAGFQPAPQSVQQFAPAQPAYAPGDPNAPQFMAPQPSAFTQAVAPEVAQMQAQQMAQMAQQFQPQQQQQQPVQQFQPQQQQPVQQFQPQQQQQQQQFQQGGVPPMPGAGQPAAPVDAAAVAQAIASLGAAPTFQQPQG